MSTPVLRALAKAYSEKLIDRKVYIRERRRLIDDIVSGEVAIVPYEPPGSPAESTAGRTFSNADATLEIPQPDAALVASPAPQHGKKTHSGAVILTISLAILIGIAWWRMAGETKLRQPPTDPAPSVANTPAKNPAEELLNNFLESNQWRGAPIDEFIAAWELQPKSVREALVDSPVMRRAGDLITQKFLEEKALLDLDAQSDALLAQRYLLDLANALAITNDRITRQEKEWQANQNTMFAGTAVPVNTEGADAIIDASTTDAPPPFGSNDDAVTVNAGPDGTPPAISEVTRVDADPENASGARTPADESPPLLSASSTAASVPGVPPLSVAATAPDAVAPVPKPAHAAATAAAATTEVRGTGATDAKASRAAPKPSSCRAEIAKQRRPYCRDALGPTLKGPPLVVLPPGQVEIGGRNPEEQPRRLVTFTRPFGIGVYEVSFEEFRVFCQRMKRDCPQQPWSDPKLPVVNVSWDLAGEYVKWLSTMSGATYRLPSESEWEYAARGGTTTPYPFGEEALPTHARFSFRGIETSPVAATDRTVNRNKFRLYHTIGNVREWVLDVWQENHESTPLDGSARQGNSSERVARGGSYSDGADRIRSASRIRVAADSGDESTGFRVLREIE